MPRIKTVEPATAGQETQAVYQRIQAKLGVLPNMMKTMAQSPAVLKAYLDFSGALGRGVLSGRLQEQVAIAIAEANGCDYCLSAHTALGSGAGLSAEELSAARKAESANPKEATGLQFARKLVKSAGHVGDVEIERLRAAGYSDPEIVELIANAALNVFTNYFNVVAQTDIDFARVPAGAAS